jgi:hypothetical protein
MFFLAWVLAGFKPQWLDLNFVVAGDLLGNQTRLTSIYSHWGMGQWQPQKITSDSQRDASKRHA